MPSLYAATHADKEPLGQPCRPRSSRFVDVICSKTATPPSHQMLMQGITSTMNALKPFSEERS